MVCKIDFILRLESLGTENIDVVSVSGWVLAIHVRFIHALVCLMVGHEVATPQGRMSIEWARFERREHLIDSYARRRHRAGQTGQGRARGAR